MSLLDRIRRLFRRPGVTRTSPPPHLPGPSRGQVDHVIVLDGTLASLRPGQDSNAGRAWHLMREPVSGANRRSMYYEPGLQWSNWHDTMAVLQGRGIDAQICRAYGYLASHFREGDRIFLLGYSRGAYAVRSLAGVIERVGLLRHEVATERNVTQAWRHYQNAVPSPAQSAFRTHNCHAGVVIEMVGVWDTVKALGLRLPLLWMLTEGRTAYHDHDLGASVRQGFQALALHETRAVFSPVMWSSIRADGTRDPRVAQVWFRGAHSDIGGQLGSFDAARPLANIPLVWMLEQAEACGLALPPGWHARFACDPKAPMVGAWGWSGAPFLLRRPRRVGLDPSESLHPSVSEAERPRWTPWSVRVPEALQTVHRTTETEEAP